MIIFRSLRIPRRPVAKPSPGFTLVELSVVVVIIGLIMTLGLGALNAQLTSASYAETKKRQSVIKDALTAYLGANRRLPCPDIPNNTNGSADGSQVTGNEDRSGIPATCAADFGVVPYAALGLTRDLATDGWGNFMSFRIAIDSPAPTCPGNGKDWSRSECFGSGKGGLMTLFNGPIAAPTPAAANLIAVLVSHGPNGHSAWVQQASRNADPVTCEEAHNAQVTTLAGCTLAVNRFYNGERPENDDVVTPLTANEAINTLAKFGTIKTATARAADDLGGLFDDALGVVLVNGCDYAKSGGNPGSPRAPSPTIRDPWGNLYLLTDNIAYKGISDPEVTLNASNATSALCLYSRGEGGAGVVTPTTCTASEGTPLIRSVSKPALEGYMAKAGKPNC